MNNYLLSVTGSVPLLSGPPVNYPDPAKEIEIKLTLRSRPLTPEKEARFRELLTQPPHLRSYLTHAHLADELGGYATDVEQLEAYFQPFGIHVKNKSRGLVSGQVTLVGRIFDFEQALHTEIAYF